MIRRPALVAALALLAPASSARAHAVVFPKTSAPGAYERYVLRVPNERQVATTRVELRVPEGMRVTAFADVPGWQLEVLTDSARRVTGAVWTGTLAPQRFAEFPFVAANPKTAGRVAWPAYQTYANGERVAWTGPEGARTPASSTTIAAPTAADGGGAAAGWPAWAALGVGLLSLGLTLRREAPRRGGPPPGAATV